MYNYFRRSIIYKICQKIIIIIFGKRDRIAKKYIFGKGIEVGALDTPLKVASGKANVTYLDRMDNNALSKHYPELNPKMFVHVGVIDDGEKLTKIKNNSQDFVIANHFIEHCEDPIKTLINHLRVLKKGGVLYWAVPNRNKTFDKKRKMTSFDHLWEDYKIGSRLTREKHYYEWVRHILQTPKINEDKKVVELMEERYSIHFHSWTPSSFFNFLKEVKKKLNLHFQILDLSINLNEFIVVIRKSV